MWWIGNRIAYSFRKTVVSGATELAFMTSWPVCGFASQPQ